MIIKNRVEKDENINRYSHLVKGIQAQKNKI
jgi:hypothetical protein